MPEQLRAFAVKPGEVRNPMGKPKNIFNLQARCRELGPRVLEVLIRWLESDDFRASLPAARMLASTGFPEFLFLLIEKKKNEKKNIL